MKIFGFNIPIANQKVTAAENKPARIKSAGKEVGDSGTDIYSGFITEEYNPKLNGTLGIKIYDKMRKNDGTVAAVNQAVTLPIMQANWFIASGTDDGSDEEMRSFADWALFEAIDNTWQDLLRHALLSLLYGVMPFEKVFTVTNYQGKDYVILKKLAPRMPKTINAWEMSNGKPGLQQYRRDGKLADIPMEKLVIFVHQMEGENWWGTSILRPAYKHWFYKDSYYQIDAIAFERQGVGLPYVEIEPEASAAERAQAAKILKNIRANHKANLIIPKGYNVGFFDMKGSTTRKADDAIQHHNREIVKAVLAQFLELGASDTGSRALSSDHSDLFLTSLNAVAQNIADTFNKHVIKPLIDLNFDNVEHYPYLSFSGITRTDVQKVATAYKTLTEAGGVTPGRTDERYFRDLLSLPERDEDDVVEMPAKKVDNPARDMDVEESKDDTEDTIDKLGLSEFLPSLKKKLVPERAEIRASLRKHIADVTPKDQIAIFKEKIALIADIDTTSNTDSRFFSSVRGELHALLTKARKQHFAETNDFKSFRKLTFAEKKVDFKSIERMLDEIEDQMDAETRALLEVERQRFMKKMTMAVNRGDREAVKAAVFGVKTKYARIIKQHTRDAYERGKKNAALEMGVKAPATPKAILDQLDIQADAIAEAHMAQLTTEAKTKVTEALARGESVNAALAAADAALAKKIKQLTMNTSRIVVAGAVNNGRRTAQDDNIERIYALQRSEVLDSKTCNYCLSVDGRVIEKDDPFGRNNIFHSGCRGIWVEIMIDEEELPPIGGIPGSLRDRFGDAVNDLIQPKTPETKKDSAARKEAEKRAKRKKDNG